MNAQAAPSALSIIDQAFSLLRQAPPRAWLWWAGGVLPFALALLHSFTELTSARSRVADLPALCCLLAVLFLWMCCAQAAFIQLLRSTLGKDDGDSIPLRRMAVALIPIASVAPAGLLLSFFSLIAAPASLTFVHAAAAFPFAARRSFGTRDVFRYAAKHAGTDSQSSILLAMLLSLFAVVVLLNMAVLLLGGPFLVKALTGAESEWTRNPRSLFNSTTFFTIFVLSAMLMDPLVKAVYSIRCFWIDATANGEDLLAALAGQGTAAVPIMFAVTPTELQRAIGDVARQSEYTWRVPPPAPDPSHSNAFVRFTDDIFRSLGKAFEGFGQWLNQVVDAILRVLTQEPQLAPRPGAVSAPAEVGPIVLGLSLVIAIAVAVVIFLQLRRSRQDRQQVANEDAAPAAVTASDLHKEDLSPTRLPTDDWLALADECARKGDYRAAARAAFLSMLSHLAQRGYIGVHAGKSNGDYARELSRRARTLETLPLLFRSCCFTFEKTWYGGHVLTSDLFQGLRREILEARTVAEPS